MSRLFDASYIIAQRQEAALWADVRMSQAEAGTQGFVVLDLETTDMSGAAEPVQITVINHEGVALMNTLVKPGCKISPQAYQTHGLSWNRVKDSPTFPQVLEDFRRIVSGQIVIAFNLKFDRRIIHQTVEKYRLRPPGAAGYECAMLKYAQFKGTPLSGKKGFKNHSLTAACEQCEITHRGAHEALGDCLATLDLIQYMALAKYGK